MPSRSSAMIASRTGSRLTPSVLASSSCGMRSPGRSLPSKTNARMYSATCSPLLRRSHTAWTVLFADGFSGAAMPSSFFEARTEHPYATPRGRGAARNACSMPVAGACRSQPAAAAHRHDRLLAVGALELVHRLGDQHRAGAAERVAERDRAAVGVDAAPCRRSSSRSPREHHRRERLVDLDEVDVVDREPVAARSCWVAGIGP